MTSFWVSSARPSMNTKIALISICVIAAGATPCIAQANDSQSITNWGPSVQGLQLAITTTNNVFAVGSSSVVTAVIENSSTNPVTIEVSAPTLYFDVLLRNETGKSYHITTRMMIRSRVRHVTVMPGKETVELIPVTFGKDIEPGDYTLTATRHVSSGAEKFELESNSIRVTVMPTGQS